MKPITDMTPAELRIACAEKCGWKYTIDNKGLTVYDPCGYIVRNTSLFFLKNKDDQSIVKFVATNYPDYEHDRNALHELILNVPKDKRSKFVIILGKITLNRDLPAIISMYVYDLLIADPLDIMRAFLVVMEEK